MLDVSEIRNPLDVKAIETYLVNPPQSAILGVEVPNFQAPIEIKQFRFGQSNPTYLVKDANGFLAVLRRKPSANAKLVSRSAHAIEREFYILNGIARCNQSVPDHRRVSVPKMYLLCEDESITDAVFYVMEFVDGRLIKTPDLPGVAGPQKNEYWNSIMTTISAIHLLDSLELVKHLPAKHFPQFQPEKLASSKSKPSYFERQTKTLTAMEKLQSKTVESIPHFQDLNKWLLERAPTDPSQLTLIHGDCKIDNFIFHPTEPRIVAVLDWELCTFGHPLFDLANFLQPFALPNKLNRAFFHPLETSLGREDTTSRPFIMDKLELYQKKLGRPWNTDNAKNNPIDLWDLGTVFGFLRLAVICQGVSMRVAKGTASSGSAHSFASLYKDLAYIAHEILFSDGAKM